MPTVRGEEQCFLSFYLRGADVPGASWMMMRSLTDVEVDVVDVCQTRVEAMCCMYFLFVTRQSVAVQVIKALTMTAEAAKFEIDYKVRSLSEGAAPPQGRHDCPALLEADVTPSPAMEENDMARRLPLTIRMLMSGSRLSLELLCQVLSLMGKWKVDVLAARHDAVSLASRVAEGVQALSPTIALEEATDHEMSSFQNIEIRILLPLELSDTVRRLRLLWDSPEMVKFYQELQHIVWSFGGQCVVNTCDDLLCRPKTKSLIVFGLNETLIREEIVDELLREVGEDPVAIEAAVLDGVKTRRSSQSKEEEKESFESAQDRLTRCRELEADPSRCCPTVSHEIFEKKLLALEGKDISCLKRNAFLVCRGLAMLGYRLALMSRGLDFVANLVGKYLGFEHVLSNQLEVVNGTLTGKLLGTSGFIDSKFLIDPLRKIDWLQLLRDKLAIPRRNIIVVADYQHADFLFQSCSMRIYFNASSHRDLVRVLFMMGLTTQDIRQLSERLRRRYGSLVDRSSLTLDTLYGSLARCAIPSADVERRSSRDTVSPSLHNVEPGCMEDTPDRLHPQNQTLNITCVSGASATMRRFKALVYVYGDTTLDALPHLLEGLRHCTTEPFHLLSVQQLLMQQAVLLTFMIAWAATPSEHDDHTAAHLGISHCGGVGKEILKTLVFEATMLGLRIKFTVSELDASYRGVKDATFLSIPVEITILGGPTISVPLLCEVFEILGRRSYSIDHMEQLSSATDRKMQCLQIRAHVRYNASQSAGDFERTALKDLQAELLAVCQVQRIDVLRYCRRLVVFDMDSTLIQEEVIDELARCAGVEKKVAAITEQAMMGQLDFSQSLKQRVWMLRGMPSSKLDEVERVIHFTPGARRLCSLLRLLGFRLAVVSGGFTRFARYVKRELGLHHCFANNLDIDQETGRLTGRVVGPVVTPQRKAAILQMLAELEQCSPEQVIAIGDGANDIAMLMKAGMGVAFCAKPKVQESAKFRINQKNLTNLLFLIGISAESAHQFERQNFNQLPPYHQERLAARCIPIPCNQFESYSDIDDCPSEEELLSPDLRTPVEPKDAALRVAMRHGVLEQLIPEDDDDDMDADAVADAPTADTTASESGCGGVGASNVLYALPPVLPTKRTNMSPTLSPVSAPRCLPLLAELDTHMVRFL